MSYCGSGSVVKSTPGRRVVTALKCKSWHCEDCAPDRRRQLIAKGCAGQPTKFVTLTSRRKDGITADDAARALVLAWRQIRRLLVMKYGKGSIEFLAVFEATQLGWPHLHILLRAPWLDQKWLSAQMAVRTDSPVVSIEAVRGRRKIASYVAKYTGKAPHKFGTLKRYWASKLWAARFVKTHVKDWTSSFDPMDLPRWIDVLTQMGWTIQHLSKWSIDARAPP